MEEEKDEEQLEFDRTRTTGWQEEQRVVLQRAPAGSLEPSSDQMEKPSVGTLSILRSAGLDRAPAGHSSSDTVGQRWTNVDQSPASEWTERRGERGLDYIRLLAEKEWQPSVAFSLSRSSPSTIRNI